MRTRLPVSTRATEKVPCVCMRDADCDSNGHQHQPSFNPSLKYHVNSTFGGSLIIPQTRYAPMRTGLLVLSKIYRVVDMGVFEDMAADAVRAITTALQTASVAVVSVSTTKEEK